MWVALTDVPQAKGYQVVESDGKNWWRKRLPINPDIIILNSVISDKHEIVKTLRFEKGLEMCVPDFNNKIGSPYLSFSF
jgi:hypothetical protein